MSVVKLLLIAFIVLTSCSDASKFQNLSTRKGYTIHGLTTVYYDTNTGEEVFSTIDPQNVGMPTPRNGGLMDIWNKARDAAKDNYKK